MLKHTTPISLCKKLVTLTPRCHSDLFPIPSARPISFWRTPVQYLKYLVTPYTEREREALALQSAFRTKGNGYFILQSTRPQTLGYDLADSPVGMLAWIYEKLVQWSDSYPWTDEEGAPLNRRSEFSLRRLVSIDVGIDLLVFAGGSGGVCEDLLRNDAIRRDPGFADAAGEGACRAIFLSKGDGPIPQS